MNLLQLQRGHKHYATRVLFDDASFAVNQGEHVGVIGPNGAGKTTLFKILVGQEHLDDGELTKAQQLKIGYLEQEAEWALDLSAEEYLTQNCTKPIWELKQIGKDIGLTEEHFQSQLRQLSGGYRMRMKLIYLIGQEPNLMLLDEPTNFLDLESVLALEKFLQGYSGAFLLISHDREFLKRTTEYTLEVEGGDINKYPGNIDDYFEQKAQLRAILEAQVANQDIKRKQVQDFVSRFGAKATKAKQAQSRLKQLDKMEKVELKDLPVRARIKIPDPIHTGRDSLRIENADMGYAPTNAILTNVNVRLERGAHLGVVGVNGAGKSTLLKSLAGLLPLLNGNRELGYQVSLSYFSQHSADQLNLGDTVLDALQSAAHREVARQDVLNMAGSLLFQGDDVSKRIKVLSGGEKSRVALGQILLKRSPLLLLDEPTNHLDFDTVEALTEALRDYAGTVVVVSHDRSFIGRIATRILEINHGKVELYPGTYDEYVWSVQKGALSERTSTNNTSSSSNTRPTQEDKPSANRKQMQAEIKLMQREISKTEKQLTGLQQAQEQLTQELLAAQGTQAATLSKEYGMKSQEIIRLEEVLLSQMEALDAKEKQLS